MISVIIPVYMVEKYIEKAVKSVMDQTFTDIEIILVDDGSTDRCGVICDALAVEDPRITVIHKQNGGVSGARNAGIEIAKGEYICFVDSDDYIDRNMLSELFNSLTRNAADLSVISRVDIGAFGILEHNIKAQTVSTDNLGDFLKGISQITIMNSPCGKLFCSDIIRKYNLRFCRDMEFAEDAVFVLEYVSCCRTISFINKAMYFYNKTVLNSACQRCLHKRDEYLYRAFLQYKKTLECLRVQENIKEFYLAQRALHNFISLIDYYRLQYNGAYFTLDRFSKVYDMYSVFFNKKLGDMDWNLYSRGYRVLETLDKETIYKMLKKNWIYYLTIKLKFFLRNLYLKFKN